MPIKWDYVQPEPQAKSVAHYILYHPSTGAYVTDNRMTVIKSNAKRMPLEEAEAIANFGDYLFEYAGHIARRIGQ
jgi:hypothetical protein